MFFLKSDLLIENFEWEKAENVLKNLMQLCISVCVCVCCALSACKHGKNSELGKKKSCPNSFNIPYNFVA